MAGLMPGGVDGWLGVRRLTAGAPGTVGASVKTITFADSPYTVLPTDWTIEGDTSGGIVIANLPSPVGISGQEYRFKKITGDANVFRINAGGGGLIDGIVSLDLTGQWDAITVVSDGTNWLVF